MRHVPAGVRLKPEDIAFSAALAQAERPSAAYDVSKWLFVPNSYQEYRYLLGTRGKDPLLCIGVNPSTAAPDSLDPTLKSVQRIALQNGFESWDYGNAGTLTGTVIGLDGEGGRTAYNDHAAAQTPGGSKVKLAFFKELINRLAARLQKLLRMFGIKETVC